MPRFYRSLTVVILVLALVAGGWLIVRHYQQLQMIGLNQSSVTDTPTPEPSPETSPTSLVYYPLPNYASRLTKRTFGQYFAVPVTTGLVCGGSFTGYHNGDDLEVMANELGVEVPVFAVADGPVRQFSHVNGYGGLLVIQHELNGQTVTANYGHVDLSQPQVKVGDTVKAGQKVAYLGDACSSETDGERKHLHFALHKGTTLNVKGYVQTRAELDNWLDPKALLDSLSAVEPGT